MSLKNIIKKLLFVTRLASYTLDCGPNFMSPLVELLMDISSPFLLSFIFLFHLLELVLLLSVHNCFDLAVLLILVSQFLLHDFPKLLLAMDLIDSMILALNQERHHPLFMVSNFPILVVPFPPVSSLPFLVAFLEVLHLVGYKDLLVVAFHWNERLIDDLL
jgi:hypothetical protein